jgi:hypothetical protein
LANETFEKRHEFKRLDKPYIEVGAVIVSYPKRHLREKVLLIPQLAAEVVSKTCNVDSSLTMDPEKSATSQFFIIKPELPVKGIASPTNN